MTQPAAPLMPIDVFINPFLRCTQCGVQVVWSRADGITNHPCGHKGYRSACMTWSPAVGCTCKERFGEMKHPGPAEVGPIAAALTTTTAPKV